MHVREEIADRQAAAHGELMVLLDHVAALVGAREQVSNERLVRERRRIHGLDLAMLLVGGGTHRRVPVLEIEPPLLLLERLARRANPRADLRYDAHEDLEDELRRRALRAGRSAERARLDEHEVVHEARLQAIEHDAVARGALCEACAEALHRRSLREAAHGTRVVSGLELPDARPGRLERQLGLLFGHGFPPRVNVRSLIRRRIDVNRTPFRHGTPGGSIRSAAPRARAGRLFTFAKATRRATPKERLRRVP